MRMPKQNAKKMIALNCLSTLLSIGCCGLTIFLLLMFAFSGGSGLSPYASHVLGFIFFYGYIIFGISVLSSWTLIFLKRYTAAMWVGFTPCIVFFILLLGCT